MRNFYHHQDRARAITRRFLLAWCLGVAFLVAMTSLILARIWHVFTTVEPEYGQRGPVSWLNTPLEVVLICALVVILGMLIAGGVKWLHMSEPGIVVARSLRAHEISPDTEDPDEQRARNIVHEMALAANMPVPRVCVMPDTTINAFAAGHTPEDAAIGLTRGAIEKLSREELQGVIAHEFSHIANGDMRMNMRIVAAIAGMTFLFVAGRQLGNIGLLSDRKGHAYLLLAGLALMIMGLAGIFASSLVKAAVSRQREYLADASAVQFTRNPQGIAGALEKIKEQGAKIQAPEAAEYSHFFFSKSLGMTLFSTHPPLEKRIARLRGKRRQ